MLVSQLSPRKFSKEERGRIEMRNVKWFISFIFVLFAVASIDTNTVQANQPITVVFDGEVLAFDVPPAIINGRTMVPMRVIFEAHGAGVYWDEYSYTVTAILWNGFVAVRINDYLININGTRYLMDVAPIIIGGRTLVPARFVSEALGSEVIWDEVSRTVFITSAPFETNTTLEDEWDDWVLDEWDWIEWPQI